MYYMRTDPGDLLLHLWAGIKFQPPARGHCIDINRLKLWVGKEKMSLRENRKTVLYC